MKLHRLVLENYRGIVQREIEFPDHGVVVVCGANEIGKSSMIEALDLLLQSRDRSTKKDVKQVKPTNADVGSEVTAEISSGPYRFVYHKRFHKKCETELTVLTPRREQLTGDEAHERVGVMMAETMDTGLWQALRVLQAASIDAVDLSGCDALSRALDIAAGDSGALSGTEPLLLDRIDTEYACYFTPTGRDTGDWSASISRLKTAEDEVAHYKAAVAEVDDRVHRHAELTDELADLTGQLQAAGDRRVTAQVAADKIAELIKELRETQLIATAKTATSTGTTEKHAERLRLCTQVDNRAATIAATDAQVQEATAAQSTAREVNTAADAAAEEADRLLAAARQRAEKARSVVDQLSDREEANRLSSRLARIDAIGVERDRVCDELSGIAMTEAVLRRIEEAATAVDRGEAQLALTSTTMEFTAAADIELTFGDQRVSLAAGQSWSAATSGPTEVGVTGVLRARISPAVTAQHADATYAVAQQGLSAALEAGAVSDLAAARSVDTRRRELQSSHDQLTATLTGLTGDDQLDALRARLQQLCADQRDASDDITMDSATARAELDEADVAHAQAIAECEKQRSVAAVAAQQLTEKSTRAAALLDKLTDQRAELDTVADELALLRGSVSDDDLAIKADSELQAAQSAQRRVDELAGQHAAAAPDAVAAELAEAGAAADALRNSRDDTARALEKVSVELDVFGTEGRRSKLDIAETEREHAAAEHSRVGRRARAVQLLRSMMKRHRDNTRLRYVEPFRAEIERLGRPVFGPSFEVDVDSELRICHRTLDGRTVPYDSLSGGAKEQLGILVRLAGAALVAKEDTVPVLIDDALGFTDPGRLARMSEVFDTVGAHGQVIVLTCHPTRYDGVTGAHRIDLSA